MCAVKSPVVFLIGTCICAVKGFEVSPSNHSSTKDVDGHALIHLGRTLNSSLLKLVGYAVLNVQCHTTSCLEWTVWSRCKPVLEHFGYKNRTRKCGIRENDCELKVKNETESQSTLCDLLWCPPDYDITSKGYCLKFSKDTQSWSNAKSKCGKDGGHLINIDSEEKAKELDLIYQVKSMNVWVDGIQKASSGLWEYSSGSKKPSFSKWYPGQPNETKHPNCKYIVFNQGSRSGWHWWDNACSLGYRYICEIEGKTN